MKFQKDDLVILNEKYYDSLVYMKRYRISTFIKPDLRSLADERIGSILKVIKVREVDNINSKYTWYLANLHSEVGVSYLVREDAADLVFTT